MDHDRSFHLALGVLEFQTETDGKLEIKLNSSGLVDSVQGIQDLDIDLGTIESTITRVDLPVAFADEFIQGLGESSFGLSPQLNIAHSLLRTSGQFELERHSENTVNVFHEVQDTADFLLDLVGTAEDVGIILLETADTSQAVQGTRQFITMKDTEVGETDRQFYRMRMNWFADRTLVGVERVLEHEAVAGTVHGLQTVFGVIAVEQEHVVLEVSSSFRVSTL